MRLAKADGKDIMTHPMVMKRERERSERKTSKISEMVSGDIWAQQSHILVIFT